jgi:hypothetical protein
LLDRGLFDALFVADIFGVDVYGGSADAAFLANFALRAGP